MERVRNTVIMILATLMLAAWSSFGQAAPSAQSPVVAEGLAKFAVEGGTDLPGRFYLSSVFRRNLIVLDGKGNIVWSKHEEQPNEGANNGWWDFKKHQVNGKTYYSYHDQTGAYDNYGLTSYAPGERVILDENFNELKRITFEASEVTAKGAPLDGHDFLMLDLDHYILSGYIHDTVYNIPGHEQGSKVVYSYLQEVDHGNVVWEWKSIDYPELYALSMNDSLETANDFANEKTEVPDYVHFNSMCLDAEGRLLCSFRHLNSIMCLDRTRKSDQILWKLSGDGDEFGLPESQKTSGQHYITLNGSWITVFDNNNLRKASRVTSYAVDADRRQVVAVRSYSFPGRFSYACGSAQILSGDIGVIGWGGAVRNRECMSVYDFSKGHKLMAVILDDPYDAAYRCAYYE